MFFDDVWIVVECYFDKFVDQYFMGGDYMSDVVFEFVGNWQINEIGQIYIINCCYKCYCNICIQFCWV